MGDHDDTCETNPGWCKYHNKPISDIDWAVYCRWTNNKYCVPFLRSHCMCGPLTEEDVESRTLDLQRQIEELTRPVPKVERECSGRWYLITFTQPDTNDSPIDLLKRSRKVINSKQVSPTMWAMALELTAKGTPHTHIRLFSEKYFDYKKVCNFNGGYRAEVQAEKHTSELYVVKADSKPSKEYLEKYGLDRCFWYSDNYSGKLFSPPEV